MRVLSSFSNRREPFPGTSVNEMQWVQSGGGPLIVIPVEIAHHWRGDGGLGLPDGDLSIVWETVRDHTDYGRGCGMDDYLGILEVGPGRCLVLGDEPMATTFFPIEEGGVFVRWIYAENEEDVVRAVRSVPESLWERFPQTFDVGKAGLLLLDSACPGDDLRPPLAKGIYSWMKLSVPNGTYQVYTADYEPDDRTHLILHRLQRL
jgi:hypothetical protein